MSKIWNRRSRSFHVMWKNCSFTFSKNSMPQLKMHLANSPSLRAAYTGQYAEIFSSETSKGAFWCIGDWENDLSMFEASEMKFAMGNAVEILKKKPILCFRTAIITVWLKGLRYWKWWLLKPSFLFKNPDFHCNKKQTHNTDDPVPPGAVSSGICAKFIPYHPAISVNGIKSVVTIVSTFIISFCRISICVWCISLSCMEYSLSVCTMSYNRPAFSQKSPKAMLPVLFDVSLHFAEEFPPYPITVHNTHSAQKVPFWITGFFCQNLPYFPLAVPLPDGKAFLHNPAETTCHLW